MKNSTLSLLKGMAMGALVVTGSAANAANFVAVASGNYSSAATWGGTAPSTNITADNITIPTGITVNLDQDVSMTGSSNLTVAGQLNSVTNEYLSVTNGATLTGAGAINVDSLTLGGASASLSYIGNIMTRSLTSNGLSIGSGATITATDAVHLNNGTLALNTVNMTLDNGGKVYMSGGNLAVGGTANLNLNNYDVVYTNGSATTGLELSGPGLESIYIDVPSAATVTLSSDLTMDDTLYLNSGILNLNGNDLSFTGNGNVAAGGTATISSTSGSDLSLMSNNNFAGDLRFTSGANTVGDLTVNMGSAGTTANIGSELNVDGTLSLQTGKLSMDDNLTVGASGSIAGGSPSSYVVTDGGGVLILNVATGTTDSFMIGTMANFAPVAVTVNPGSTGGEIAAAVVAGIAAGGLGGTNLALTQPVVNATWVVGTDATSNINMNVAPIWSSGMEVNGFNRNEAYVSINPDGTWTVETSAAASAAANGMFSLTHANSTEGFAAYSVMDKDAVNNVAEVRTDKGLSVYPNPVVNTLYFKSATSLRAPVVVNIYDVAGHLVKTAVADNSNGVPVTELAAGFYTVQFSSGDFKAVEKFVKQ